VRELELANEKRMREFYRGDCKETLQLLLKQRELQLKRYRLTNAFDAK